MITPSVQALDDTERTQLLQAVRDFEQFDGGNDPWHEHDFGAIDLFEQKWFWQFAYYDHTLRMGSDDPSNTEKTRRVLTVMHSSDY